MNASLQLKLDDELSVTSASLLDSGFQASYYRTESKPQRSISFVLRDTLPPQSTASAPNRSVELLFSSSGKVPAETTGDSLQTTTAQRTNPRFVRAMDNSDVQHPTSLLHKATDHKSLYRQLVSNGSLDRQDLRSGENCKSSGKVNIPLGISAAENSLRTSNNNTDLCLSMVNETRPSYKMKTAGKTPLSSSHLLSLVDSDLNKSPQAPPIDGLLARSSRSPAQTYSKNYSKSTTSTPSVHFDSDALFEELNDAVKARSKAFTKTYTAPSTINSCSTSYRKKYSEKQDPIKPNDEAELDRLTSRLVHCMRTGKDECAKCGDTISSGKACTALDQTYHVTCFTCVTCGQGLAGKSFYSVEGKPYCEADYLETLEKCCCCYAPITDKVLRANGKAYHPTCFVCSTCSKCLDGVPFTVDEGNRVHCITCFHEKYAPKCVVCTKPIVPEAGSQESVRIVALDKSFHVNCYRCEDCGLQLSSKVEGHECYPLDNHILCKDCSTRRIRQMTS